MQLVEALCVHKQTGSKCHFLWGSFMEMNNMLIYGDDFPECCKTAINFDASMANGVGGVIYH